MQTTVGIGNGFQEYKLKGEVPVLIKQGAVIRLFQHVGSESV